MKRLLIPLLLLALLTGCGGDMPDPEASGSELAEATSPEGLTMELERTVYDPSVTRYTYFIHNNTEKAVDFGEAYRIQRRENGRWVDLTPEGDLVFSMIGYCLEPGRSTALTCGLSGYQDVPKEGTYRLVKSVGNSELYAEFQLGESIYTAETPYGFVPLEELPENYGADGTVEADAVWTGSRTPDLEPLENFLFKAGLRASCQLRMAEERDGAVVSVTDVIYENRHFLLRVRDMEQGGVTEQRYACLVTDGQGLYLSNGVDWASGEQYNDARMLLLPDAAPELVMAVTDMTEARIYENVSRYYAWSADGIWHATLVSETPTEFGVGWQKPAEGSWSCTYDLQYWDGTETAIVGIAWQADNTLLLHCRTASGETSWLTFNPETEQLLHVDAPLAQVPS